MSFLQPYQPRNLSGRDIFSHDFFRPFWEMTSGLRSDSFRVDIREKEDYYLLEAELPGVAPEQVEISLEDNTLTITANLEAEQHKEKDDYIYSERRTGRMQRSFHLDNVREEDINAHYHNNGILHVRLPKAEPEQQHSRRHISIDPAH